MSPSPACHAEMVPVGGEDDRFRLEVRVASFDHAEDVARDDLLHGGRDVPLDADAERNRLEALGVGLLERLVHGQADVGEQLFAGAIDSQPAKARAGLSGGRTIWAPLSFLTTEYG